MHLHTQERKRVKEQYGQRGEELQQRDEAELRQILATMQQK